MSGRQLAVAAAGLVLALAAAPAHAEWPEEAPGFVVPDKWSYAKAPADLPLPRVLIYAPLTIERLEATAKEWSRNGFSGVIVAGIMPVWWSDVWAADGEQRRLGAAAEARGGAGTPVIAGVVAARGLQQRWPSWP